MSAMKVFSKNIVAVNKITISANIIVHLMNLKLSWFVSVKIVVFL